MIKAGFARVDVTPPLGTPIAGYFNVRKSDGVRDPIELNAIAFGNEQDAAILIACDFTGMTMARIIPLREKISAATGVAADRILITSLHQHTSIYVGDAIGDAEDYALITDTVYLNILERKLLDVAKMALDEAPPTSSLRCFLMSFADQAEESLEHQNKIANIAQIPRVCSSHQMHHQKG